MADKHDKDFWGGVLAFAILGTPLLLAGGCWSWYRAGVQSEVYSRQGVEMTQWECFLNMKPIERTINIK
jgi:hypothetical protein